MEYDLVRKITPTVVNGVIMHEHLELADDGGVWAMATYPSSSLKMEKVEITVSGAIDTGICPFCKAMTDVYEMYYPSNAHNPLYYHICHQCLAGVFEHEMGVARPTAQATPSVPTHTPPSSNHGTLPSRGQVPIYNVPSIGTPVASSNACSRCGADNWELKEIPDFWNATKKIQVKKCRQCGNCP